MLAVIIFATALLIITILFIFLNCEDNTISFIIAFFIVSLIVMFSAIAYGEGYDNSTKDANKKNLIMHKDSLGNIYYMPKEKK